MGRTVRSILRLEVPIIVRVGETPMNVSEAAALAPGAIIELPKRADEQLDLLVNNVAIAQGAAVKVGENFGLGIAYVGDLKERIEALGGLKIFVQESSYLQLGAGGAITPTSFQAANLRFTAGFVFEPSIGDRDGDGFVSARCCNAGPDGLRCGADCSDERRDVRPGFIEVCDEVDNDCDGSTDEGVTVEACVGADGDLGGGEGSVAVQVCAGRRGYSSVADDCDDTEISVHGAQLEITDGLDNDCDGTVDEGVTALRWYPDLDGDAYGDPEGEPVLSSAPLLALSLRPSDCASRSRSSRTRRCSSLALRGTRIVQVRSRKCRLISPSIVRPANDPNAAPCSGSNRSTALTNPNIATCRTSSAEEVWP